MDTQLLSLDLSKEDGLAEAVPMQSLLSSYAANWQGIHLEYHRTPPFEVPEYTCQQHIITIPTVKGIEVERIAEGKSQQVVFHPGDLCFAPRNFSLRTRWQQQLEAVHLILEPDLLAQTAFELIEPDQVEFSIHAKQCDPLIYNLGIALKQSLATFGDDSKLYAESAATFLAVHLIRHYATHRPKHQGHSGGLSPLQRQQAIDYIQAHLAEDICLEALSTCLGLSRYYFCRLFKQSTGCSPYKYIIRCRVERAKELLKRGGLTLAEIALACGFSHQSHLHRHFKRQTGVTPKEFANLQ